MKNLIFNRAEVLILLAHSKNARERLPTLEQLCDPSHRKDGRTPDEGHWPTTEEVNIETIPFGLWLVADQGIYLMSNSKERDIVTAQKTRCRVAYADGVNSESDDFGNWWENKRLYMGGDDQCLFINGSDLELHMARRPDSGHVLIGVETNGQTVTHTLV